MTSSVILGVEINFIIKKNTVGEPPLKKKRLSADQKLLQENSSNKVELSSTSRRPIESPEIRVKKEEIKNLKKEIRKLQRRLFVEGEESDPDTDDPDFEPVNQLSLKFLEVLSDNGVIKKVSPVTLR